MITDFFTSISCDENLLCGSDSFIIALNRTKSLLDNPDISLSDKISIRLALLRIYRIRFLREANEIEKELEELLTATEQNGSLELKRKIVEAEIVLFRRGDIKQAVDLFQAIVPLIDAAKDPFLYALVANGLGVSLTFIGQHRIAEEYYQDCLSIFRKMGIYVLYAHSLNNLAVLKKMVCEYTEARRLFKNALRLYESRKMYNSQVLALNNLAVVKMKLGEWDASKRYLDRAIETRKRFEYTPFENDDLVYGKEELNLSHLRLLQRNFSDATDLLVKLIKNEVIEGELKLRALAHEFLSEVFLETKHLGDAERQLDLATKICKRIAPDSDIMTDIKRRQAQLCLLRDDPRTAKYLALECIKLCRGIRDKHEMGAALRILAESNLKLGLTQKAVSAFEASINTLKGIHECYELMRSCISYSRYLIESNSEDADIYLLEARQLCKKLKIDYFTAQVLILYSKYDFKNGDMVSARHNLKLANEYADRLNPCDKKTIAPLIREWYKTLEKAILQTSKESAERLKSLGRIYEEARFPLEELKPELATEVARNVGAESLFLAKQQNSGYRVPVKYNLSINDAKQILRRQLRCDAKTLFKGNDPRFCPMMNGKTLVSVPGQTDKGFILCAVVPDRKSFTPKELEFLFASVEAMERVATEIGDVPSHVDATDFLESEAGVLAHPGGSFEEIITIDPGLIKVIRLAERASQSSVPILLEGETGVGKELFAHAIHENSSRKDGPFVAINAAGVPLNLLESQLFGHVKGAFTDAVSDRIGLVEEAKGGTLFFDEVGDMSEELQVKLLRLLENGEFRRLGENDVRHTNVRVVSATNKNLEDRISSGLFREDLYYRLATVSFKIPPLRERRRDIEFLLRHFLTRGIEKLGFTRRRLNVDMKALEAFELYNWPGNVRELRNEIMRILSLIGDGEVIRFGMLSERVKDAFRSGNESGILTQRVERFERRLILKALEDNSWNRSRTAEQIGIPRTTLLFKMKTLNIL